MKSKLLAACGIICAMVLGAGVARAQETPDEQERQEFLQQTLKQARAGFATKLTSQPRQMSQIEPMQIAPPDLMRTIRYQAPGGDYGAYLSLPFKDGKKHPAIVWITGGDSSSVGDIWSKRAPSNDQTAVQFERAGVAMMYPSLRGGSGNAGRKEGFLGEVDDVLAAADFLAKQPEVDADRIYLGGHSTGGTLALLVAESSDRFRGVFAFGPVASVYSYGLDSELLPFDTGNEREMEIRSPMMWLENIRTPTYVIEGKDGNIGSLRKLHELSRDPDFGSSDLHFLEVAGAGHFDVLAPANALLARFVIEQSRTVGADRTITQSAFDDALATQKP